jgi:hypothetical protein
VTKVVGFLTLNLMSSAEEYAAAMVGIIIVAIIFLIFMPMAVIWAVNTLFHFGIPITFQTWLATVVLGAFIKGSTSQIVTHVDK